MDDGFPSWVIFLHLYGYHCQVYVLGGINALKQELQAAHGKVEEKVEKGHATLQNLLEQIKDAGDQLNLGLIVLRQMVLQVSAVNVEFADPWIVYLITG